MNKIKKYREEKNIDIWTLSRMANIATSDMQLIEDGQKKQTFLH